MSNLSNASNKESRKKRKSYNIGSIRDKLDIIKDAILKNVPVKQYTCLAPMRMASRIKKRYRHLRRNT